MRKYPRVVVAGLRGGSGKTTLSVGLAAALASRGLSPAVYKKGPDYIDAGWLAAAAGRACYNLDPFLVGEGHLKQSFLQHFPPSKIAIIEGNRGLFDGMDASGSASTSRLARMLKAPVLLIVDCTKVTRTVAAMVYGARKFERGTVIGGVVLNQFSGSRQESVIRQAVEQGAGVPVLGAIPRQRAADLPERHMGLTPWQEHGDVRQAIERARALIEAHVDIKRVIDLAKSAPGLPTPATQRRAIKSINVRIGVVRDSAFQFYYPENIEALQALGAEVVEISALTDKALPDDIDALYIGGGFPETHALALAKNKSFKQSLKRAALAGLPIYAECGGLMYLGREIVLEGKRHAMAGVLPINFTLHEKPKAHGYTVVKVQAGNPFYPIGTELKGHEFHYSLGTLTTEAAHMAFSMQRGVGIADKLDGLCMHNMLGTYTHIHALGTPQWASGLVEAARAYCS